MHIFCARVEIISVSQSFCSEAMPGEVNYKMPRNKQVVNSFGVHFPDNYCFNTNRSVFGSGKPLNHYESLEEFKLTHEYSSDAHCSASCDTVFNKTTTK